MKQSLLLLLCGALLGCGKKEAAPPPPPQKGPAVSVEDMLSSPGAKAEAAPQTPEAPPPVAETPAPTVNTGPSRPGEPANPKQLKAAVDRYFDTQGSFPSSWQDLIRVKLITSAPMGKNGKPLDYREYMEWVASGP